jgi:hypothetical protein
VNSTLFFLAATLTACQDVYYGPVYYGPPVVYGPPIVCVPADYDNIHYSGKVYSKKYVTAVMDDGSTMSVPVINGLLPCVDYKRLPSGGMQRDFWYDEGFKYRGEAIVKYGPNDKKKVVPPKVVVPPTLYSSSDSEKGSSDDKGEELTVSKKVQMPDPEIQQLQEANRELQKTIIELKESFKKQVVLDLRQIEAPSPMRKPSEFDKESK